MGKKKKTLEEKKLTELRRFTEPHGKPVPLAPTEETVVPRPSTISYTFPSVKKSATAQTFSLRHDLQKTLTVSASILVALILLFVLLQSRVFVLPLIPLRY